MTPPPALRVRDLFDLAALRLRQVEEYDAAQLYRDQPARVRRHLMRRIDRTMTPDWSADEASPARFARFAALPRRLRREARRVGAVLPARASFLSPADVAAVPVPPTRMRSRAERFPRFFASQS